MHRQCGEAASGTDVVASQDVRICYSQGAAVLSWAASPDLALIPCIAKHVESVTDCGGSRSPGYGPFGDRMNADGDGHVRAGEHRA
jgi:hypothetical protein